MRMVSFVFIYVVLVISYGCCEVPSEQQIRGENGIDSRTGHSLQRSKRSSFHVITDCVTVNSEDGKYFVKSTSDDTMVCGVYFITDPNRVVQIHFNYLNVPCDNGGLVSFIDGWELNGQYFPSPEDHQKPMSMRFHEFCGQRKVKQVFESSQNGAVIQYRIPIKGGGFSFSVLYPEISSPCNILVEGSDVYTLRNYGKRTNCTLNIMYPANIKVLALQVGFNTARFSMELESGTLTKCQKRGLGDYVQFGGSSGLDTTGLTVVDSVCGHDSSPITTEHTIFCEVSVVRLVSSGDYDNSVVVAVRAAVEEDIEFATLICGL